MSKAQKLTAAEIRAAVEEAITVVGHDDAASIAEFLIEKEAEKVASAAIGEKVAGEDYSVRRALELTHIRHGIDRLENAYDEELHVHRTGEQPVYQAVNDAG